MKILFFFLLMTAPALAGSDVLDAKNGLVVGLGAGASRFSFPDSYSGAKEKDFDDSASLFGGMAQAGYDTLLFRRVVLGLRGEGFLFDTLGTGNTSTNQLTGKTSALHLLLRIGLVFEIKTKNPVGDSIDMAMEFFIEGGPTKGKRTFDKKYDPQGSSDGYDGSVEEKYQGQAIAAGVNLTSARGAYFEVKALYTSVSSIDQTFSGTKTENGSASDLADTDGNKKNFTSVFIVFGRHF